MVVVHQSTHHGSSSSWCLSVIIINQNRKLPRVGLPREGTVSLYVGKVNGLSCFERYLAF